MLTFYSQNIWNMSPAGYRNKLVRSLVADFDADVCAFQECGPVTNRASKPSIVNAMGDAFAEAMPEVARGNYTPIFYRKDKFCLLDKGYLQYAGLNDGKSKGVSWAVLEEKETGKRLAFASTHFWYKARGQEDTDQRIANARQLKEVCDGIVAQYGIPVIIGGDFNNGENAKQDDAPYRAMLEWGFRDARYLAEESTTQRYTCGDGYPLIQLDGGFLPCPVEPHFCIDYILIYGEPSVQVKQFHIETNRKARTSSDHCPLVCRLEV